MTGRRPAPLLLSPRWRLRRRPVLEVLGCALAVALPVALILAALPRGGTGAPLLVAGALVGTAVAGAFAVSAIALWRGRGGSAHGTGRAARTIQRTEAQIEGRLDRIERAAARLERSVAAATAAVDADRARRRPANAAHGAPAGEPCAPMMPDHTLDPAALTGAAWPSPGSRAGSPAAPRRAAARDRAAAAAFEKEIERYLTVSRKV